MTSSLVGSEMSIRDRDGDKIKISREIFGTKEETSYTYSLEKKKLTLTENGKSVTFVKE